jgi:predicted nucleotidyltransferase
MKSKERKIILEAKMGSHLFGTNGPKSDEDYIGVFLPSTDDMFTLDPRIVAEWDLSVKTSTGLRNTVGDVDRKFISIQEFMRLVLSGQSRETEMLFTPPEMIIQSTPEWQTILDNRNVFLSKLSSTSFLEFAKAQTVRSTLKGTNLNLIRDLIKLIESEPVTRVRNFLETHKDNPVVQRIQTTKSEKGGEIMAFVGKKWDVTISTKQLKSNLKKIESSYGSRSQKSAEDGFDYKSLHHAYRLMGQAKEFLTTGQIILPRPTAEADFLKKVKFGEYVSDYFKELDDLNDEIKDLLASTNLVPEQPDLEKAKKLCKALLYNHLFG